MGMIRVPAAKPSPRVRAGVLKWYAGDMFRLIFQLELTDQDGAPVALGAEDSLTVQFFDETQQLIYAASPTVTDNQAELIFDDEVSEKFGKGTYFYDIRCTHENRLTLVRQNRVVVE